MNTSSRLTYNKTIQSCLLNKQDEILLYFNQIEDLVYLQIPFNQKQIFKALIGICLSICSLKIKFPTSQQLRQISQLKMIKKLTIDSNISINRTIAQICKMNQLTTLRICLKEYNIDHAELNNVHIQKLVEKLPILEQLDIQGSRQITSEGIKKLKQLKFLKSFAISLFIFTSDILKSICQYLSHLSCLKFGPDHQYYYQSKTCLPYIFENYNDLSLMKKLQNLVHLEFRIQISVRVFEYFPSNIKIIRLTAMSLMPQFVKYLVNKCTLIENIILQQGYLYDESAEIILKQLKKLKQFSLIKVSLISRIGIQKLISNKPNIKILSLSDCNNIPGEAIKMISQLKHLQKLRLRGREYNNKALIYLRNLKYLKELDINGNSFNEDFIVCLLCNIKNLMKLTINKKWKVQNTFKNKICGISKANIYYLPLYY